MSTYVSRCLRLGAALSLAVASVVGAATNAPAAAMIHPGDKVAVTVFNHPDLSGDATVTSDGNLRIPVAGTVSVEGLSERSAAARVARALSTYLYHPSVDVRLVLQGQSIFFTGSLVGVQPFVPGETLGSAIGSYRQALAGQSGAGTTGFTRFASIDLRRVRLQRAKSISAPLDLDELARTGNSGPRLEPGDVVLLSAKPVRVDVLGYLNTPSTVYVYPGDTLAQAVAEVGAYSTSTSITSIDLRRNGVDSIVTSAGSAFTSPAQDGDVVTLQPAPHVTVLGMVEKAGSATLQTRPTLLNALYEAGGPNRFADLGHIEITHDGQTRSVDIGKLTHGDLSVDSALSDGDVVFVPEGHKIDFSLFTTVVNTLASLSVAKVF